MKTVIEMVREAGWPDSLVAPVIMAKLAEFAELVRADERARMAEQPAQQEPMDEIRCPECGYLTKHTEHIGCLRNQLNAINAFEQRNFAIVNMDTSPQPAQRKPLPDGIPSPDELEALSDGNSGMIFNTGFPTKLDNLACWLREYAAIEAN